MSESGKIDSALAHTFALTNIEVSIANSRGPGTLASLTGTLGPNIVPQSLQDAYRAEMIFLAVRFSLFRRSMIEGFCEACSDKMRGLQIWRWRSFIELSEFDWSEARMGSEGGNTCTRIDVVARYEHALPLPRQ